MELKTLIAECIAYDFKVMLEEKVRSNKWLAEQFGKNPATILKWCTNTSQPTIEMRLKIVELLKVNYTEPVRAK